MVITSSISLWGDKKEWTKEELISQLKPMCKFNQRILTEREGSVQWTSLF
jgi:hypothetical protein